MLVTLCIIEPWRGIETYRNPGTSSYKTIKWSREFFLIFTTKIHSRNYVRLGVCNIMKPWSRCCIRKSSHMNENTIRKAASGTQPLLTPPSHERPLRPWEDHIFLAEGSTFQRNWTCQERPSVLRRHILWLTGWSFKNRFYHKIAYIQEFSLFTVLRRLDWVSIFEIFCYMDTHRNGQIRRHTK